MKAYKKIKQRSLWLIDKIRPIFLLDLSIKKKTKFYQRDILPTHLALETTNICNAKCPFCPSYVHSREKGVMDFTLFKNIIDQAHRFECIEFISHGGLGEPLIDKGIFDKIKYEKARLNVEVQLHTNGILLNKDIIKKLFDSRLDTLSISINAFYHDSYKNIMGFDYERIIENIENFICLKQELKPITKLRLTLVNSSQLRSDEPCKFLKHWKNKNVQAVVHEDKNWATFSNNKFISKPTHPCKWLWSVMNIFWNGDVSICHEDYNGLCNLGNLGNNNIMKIYNSAVIKNFRKNHHERNFNQIYLCSNCSRLHLEKDFWEKVKIKPKNNCYAFSYVK